MKGSAILLFTILALLLAGTSFAGPPLSGTYQSTDLGGPVYLGRYSEGWGGGGGAHSAGTTLNAQSWDGAALGTQWKYWCSTEVSNGVLLISTVDANGNGNATYMDTFVGGFIWLSGTGPWGNGDPYYPGVIDSYVEFETVTYANWVPIASVTNVQAKAHFNNYPQQCMSFYIGNGSRVSTTDLGQPAPPEYPPFLDPNCTATPTLGACWNFFTITLRVVDCAVHTESATWGAIKSLYTN